MRRVAAIFVLSAFALALAVPAQARTSKDPNTVGFAYLQQALSATPEATTQARTLAAPGSIADQYAVFEHTLAQALRDAGRPNAPNTMKKQGRRVVACTTDVTTPPAQRCATYTDFRTDRKGHLLSFTLNGVTLAGHITVGSGQPVQVLGVTATLDVAYVSPAADSLAVLFTVNGAPDGPRSVFASSATYVGPDGHQQQVAPGAAAEPSGSGLQPGATTTLAAAFPGAALGGTLSVPVSTGSPSFQSGMLQLKVG